MSGYMDGLEVLRDLSSAISLSGDCREVTGRVKPMSLANAIHARIPSSWGGTYFVTLNNIKDCIADGDRWFEEDLGTHYRIFTDSGFSALVDNRISWM